MATANRGQTYYNRPNGSIAEDVTDVIYQITPEDTPFTQMSGQASASDVVHGWMTRSLVTRQSNKHVEGTDFLFADNNRLPTRLDNLTQILKKEFRVSRTHRAVNHYAIGNMFGDQGEVAAIELATDIEHNLITATAASGTTGTAREMQGLLAFIEANASSTFTNFAGTVTLTENLFNTMMQTCWDQGGRPKDVMVGPRIKRRVSSFDGASNQKFIGADEQRLVNTISIYENDFFLVEMHLSRDMPTNTLSVHEDMVFVDRTMVAKANLGSFESIKTAKVADSDDGVHIAELTLEVGNPNAHYYGKQVAHGVADA